MTCNSKNIKLFRVLYVPAGTYGADIDLTDLDGVGSWKELRITTGPSEMSIEQQEITLENYGDQLRNKITQHEFYKISSGSVTLPFYDAFVENHYDLLSAGFGKLTDNTETSTLAAAWTTGATIAIDLGGGTNPFTAGQMVDIGGVFNVIKSVDNDEVVLENSIPSGVTVAIGAIVVACTEFDPQCLGSDDYFHFLAWDADEYWLITYAKPAFKMNSNDGGAPLQLDMSLSSYEAIRLDTSTSDVADVFANTSLDQGAWKSIVNNKTYLCVNGAPVSDIADITFEIERANTRWESGVNARNAIGSLNDITSINGVLTVFKNKNTYHGYKDNNTEISISFQTADGSFAVFAPSAKLTGTGQNPVGNVNDQNVAMFGISWNENMSKSIKIYLGSV